MACISCRLRGGALHESRRVLHFSSETTWLQNEFGLYSRFFCGRYAKAVAAVMQSQREFELNCDSGVKMPRQNQEHLAACKTLAKQAGSTLPERSGLIGTLLQRASTGSSAGHQYLDVQDQGALRLAQHSFQYLNLGWVAAASAGRDGCVGRACNG